MAKRKYRIIKGRKIPLKSRTFFGTVEVEAGTNMYVQDVPLDECYTYLCIRKKNLAPGERSIYLQQLYGFGNPTGLARALRFAANAIESLALNNFSIKEEDIK